MRVGLVLGGGGLVGASWLIGALEALESETGWSPADAELIVGTSAGSVIGAMAAEGIPAAFMAAYSSGKALDAVAETEERGEALAEKFSDLLEGAADVAARATGRSFGCTADAPDRAGIVADGARHAAAPKEASGDRAAGRLAAARLHLDPSDQ